MKLRRPPRSAPTWHRAEDFIQSFNVELITPLYGGGVKAGEPDGEMPIRAAAIRGQLRYWWRLLNRPRLSDNIRALLQAEQAIFGGMTNQGNATASRVKVSVSDIANAQFEQCAQYPQRKDGTWITTPRFPYGPGYALFPGQGKANKYDGVTESPCNVVLPGLSFSLNITILPSPTSTAEQIWQSDLLPALRWWASFGGLGARTRRGLGSIKVEGLEPVEAPEAGCQMILREPERTDPQSAWTEAVEKLCSFRQGPNIGRNPGQGKFPGRSRWPEADSIREITGCHLKKAGNTHSPRHPAMKAFPRASFGLPIITQFKDGPRSNTNARNRIEQDPDNTVMYPVVSGRKQDRMTSPLILKAMWTGRGYVPAALLLPHGPVETMGLKLEDSSNARNPGLPCTIPAGQWWTAESAQKMTEGAIDNPLIGKTGDVLNDFLDYFRR